MYEVDTHFPYLGLAHTFRSRHVVACRDSLDTLLQYANMQLL